MGFWKRAPEVIQRRLSRIKIRASHAPFMAGPCGYSGLFVLFPSIRSIIFSGLPP
jgi:hypothetical protein